VAGFLLFSDSFPRSVSLCVRELAWLLGQLRSRYRLSGGAAAEERLDEVRAALTDMSIDTIISNGLHEFLDWLQRQFAAITVEISNGFFGRPADIAPAA
jgi:uncharacterized alpha-E superfamily protein